MSFVKIENGLPETDGLYHCRVTYDGENIEKVFLMWSLDNWHTDVDMEGAKIISWLDEQDEGWVPVERLRQQIIQDLLGNEQLADKPFLISGHDSYTRRQLAEEIQNNTEKGMEIISGAIMLAIDLTARNKVPPATT